MNSVVGQRQHLERSELLEEWTDLTEAVLAEHKLAYLTQLVLARKVEDRLLREIVARKAAIGRLGSKVIRRRNPV